MFIFKVFSLTQPGIEINLRLSNSRSIHLITTLRVVVTLQSTLDQSKILYHKFLSFVSLCFQNIFLKHKNYNGILTSI